MKAKHFIPLQTESVGNPGIYGGAARRRAFRVGAGMDPRKAHARRRRDRGLTRVCHPTSAPTC